MIVIETVLGLCNRLRVVFSYHRYAQSVKRTLVVYWVPDTACDGFFLDFFEPLPGVVFYREKPSNARVDYVGHEWHPLLNPYTTFIYEDLRLTPRMMDKINGLWDRVGDPSGIVALHVRRTDHTDLAKAHGLYTEDHTFFDVVDRNPEKRVYLATDNPKTQRLFVERYGMDRILWNIPMQAKNKKQRKTGVEDAIIDLFVCVEAHDFQGSGYSSFSDTILQLRRLPSM